MTICTPIQRRLVAGLVLTVVTAMAGPRPTLAQAGNAGEDSAPTDLRALGRALAQGNTGAPVVEAIPRAPEPRPAGEAARAPDSPTVSAPPPPQPTDPAVDTAVGAVADAVAGDPSGADARQSRWPGSAAALAELARQRLEALGFDPAADQERRRQEFCAFLARMRAPDDAAAPARPGCTEPSGN